MKKFRTFLSILFSCLTLAITIFPLYTTRISARRAQESSISYFEDALNNPDVDKTNLNLIDLKVIGVLYVPSIDVKLPVFEGTSEEAISSGCGVIPGTGDLRGAKGSDPVLTAHNGMSYSNLLMNLDKMQVGDEYYTKDDLNKIHKYVVTDIKVVEPEGEQDTFIFDKERSLSTLRTCTPTFINSHRLHVVGEEVPYIGNIPEPTTNFTMYEIVLLVIALIAFLNLLGIIFSLLVKRRKHEEK